MVLQLERYIVYRMEGEVRGEDCSIVTVYCTHWALIYLPDCFLESLWWAVSYDIGKKVWCVRKRKNRMSNVPEVCCCIGGICNISTAITSKSLFKACCKTPHLTIILDQRYLNDVCIFLWFSSLLAVPRRPSYLKAVLAVNSLALERCQIWAMFLQMTQRTWLLMQNSGWSLKSSPRGTQLQSLRL